mmetsp:Transcript_4473/g.4360  ORF Transcript_4473/g.4360 Transcript_4473/m.4360 type:complete len:122 (-) Transcript_4473:245-610(-)
MITNIAVIEKYTVLYFQLFISQSLGVVPRGLPGVDESEQFDNLWIVSLILIGLSATSLFFLWLIPNARMNERIFSDGDDTSATSGSILDRWLRGIRGSEGEEEVTSKVSKSTLKQEEDLIT